MPLKERSVEGSGAASSSVASRQNVHDVPLSKRIRRNLISLRQGTPSTLPLCTGVAIITLLICVRRSNFGGFGNKTAQMASVSDPCFEALPRKKPPRFFDFEARVYGAPRIPRVGGRSDKAARAVVFETLNEDGFFRRDADFAQNYTDTDLDLSHDAVMNQHIARHALRVFYDAPTLRVRGVWTQFVHIDAWRIQFVLRARLTKDKTTHPDTPTEPWVAQSNRVVIQRTFAGDCSVAVIPETKDVDRPPIYVVVAYSGTGFGRPRRMARFMLQVEMIQAHPILKAQQVNLIVSLHDMTEAAFREQFEIQDQWAHRTVYIVEPPTTPGDTLVPFSRGATLRVGVQKAFIPEDALVFLSDIDMHIYPSFFGT